MRRHNGDKNGDKMEIKLQQNGDKMETKWAHTGVKMETQMEAKLTHN